MRYSVYIKLNGSAEREFTTVADSQAKALSNAHAQYATHLNMNVASYYRQIKISGHAERLCEA